ncbi:hypothetical protein GF407_02630 [candidate division KSB1 bacterium]|nr:hypothetical protein [candidate division KSB1 bacterium]
MKRIGTTFLVLLVTYTLTTAQLIIKDEAGNVVMQIDNNANMVVGSATKSGKLTTNTLTILDGAGDGLVLKSNALGLAGWDTDNVDDADANPNNERQRLSYEVESGRLTINNGGATSGNYVDIPKNIYEFAIGGMQSISVLFSGETVNEVWYKQGNAEGWAAPSSGQGWSLASEGAEYTVATSQYGSSDAIGIIARPALSGISGDPEIRLLQMRVGGVIPATEEWGTYYIANSALALEKQIGDNGPGDTIPETSGLILLENNQNFFAMSQYQGNANRQLSHIVITIFFGVR